MRAIILISLILSACGGGSSSEAQTVPVRLIQTQGTARLESATAIDWYIAAEKLWNAQMMFKLELRSIEEYPQHYNQQMNQWQWITEDVVADNNTYQCKRNEACLFIMPPIFNGADPRPWFAGMGYLAAYGDPQSEAPAVATVFTTAVRHNGLTAKWITVHIILHELGHVVCGLKHARQNPISVMSPAMDEAVASGEANHFWQGELVDCYEHLNRAGKVLIRKAYQAMRRAATAKRARKLRQVLKNRKQTWGKV